MDLKLLMVVLAIFNVVVYSIVIMKVKKAEGGGFSILKKLSPKKPKAKQLKPVIPHAKSTARWDAVEEEIDQYWEAGKEEIPEKRENIGKEEKEERGEKEERHEEPAEYDEERRVRLLWENYIRKLDTFIEHLEKGNPTKYFEYYKEYENLDKFYSRFIFNFGIYLNEIEKNKASGRLGYSSTLLKEMLNHV